MGKGLESLSKVLLVPAHPSEGNASMGRYWCGINEGAEGEDRWVIQAASALENGEANRRSGRARRAWSRYVSYPWVISRRAASVDVVHILDHSSAHLLPRIDRSTVSVVTVHDLIPLEDFSGMTPGQAQRFRRQMKLLRRADALIAVSKFTKREVIRLLGISGERIHVVPNGGPQVEQLMDRGALLAEGGAVQLLSVGSCLPRKNLKILPAVIDGLRSRGVNAELIRVGERMPEALRREFPAGSLEERGFLSDDELEKAYREIPFVIIPSRAEGFGLPVLEAMARGSVVVASSSTSLPEAGGGSALYFHPDSPKEAIRCVEHAMKPEVYAILQKAGWERAKVFSWKQHWEGCAKVYKNVLEKRRAICSAEE
ncbi:MAG: glycosyltransferase family 1 protein [Verrucomicrobiota bacterium]